MGNVSFDIDKGLLRKLNDRASMEGVSLSVLVNRLLNLALRNQHGKPEYKLELRGWESELRPGVDISDRNKLFDLLDEEEGQSRRRPNDESAPVF